MSRVFFIGILFNTIFCQLGTPDLFQYNQGAFQAFYFFIDVTIDSISVDADDWVGTFNCTEWNADSTACKKLGPCVGSRKWNTAKCGGGVCDLPAIGTGGESSDISTGYLNPGEFPVFIIYDKSHDVYYKTEPEGDVKIQKDICRNGYPFCYGWKNQSFPFSSKLIGTEIYMDCMGKLGGEKELDVCGICGGLGPQYICSEAGKSYCTEAKYRIECP